jgi:hypothetical protein
MLKNFSPSCARKCFTFEDRHGNGTKEILRPPRRKRDDKQLQCGVRGGSGVKELFSRSGFDEGDAAQIAAS